MNLTAETTQQSWAPLELHAKEVFGKLDRDP